MKNLVSQNFTATSSTVIQKQGRFKRSTSKSPASNSNSSKSRDNTICSFWVKGVVTGNTAKMCDFNQTQNRKLKGISLQASPRKRGATLKSKSGKIIEMNPQQIINNQNKQIKRLVNQNEKYHVYIMKQNQKVQDLRNRNKILLKQKNDLQQQLKKLKKEIKSIETQNSLLLQKNSKKDTLIESLSSQQPAIKKVKMNIFQARSIEFQKQKQQLLKKVSDLQIELQQYRDPNQPKYNQILKTSSSWQAKLQSDQSYDFQQKTQHTKLQQELYNAKQKIKRLQISSNCAQRKHFQQLKALRQKKQKEYDELKKKFKQFIQKYKTSMKKFASNQIEKLKHKSKRSSSIQSLDSLSFSSDQEKETETKLIIQNHYPIIC